jgi:hypothetical protein
MSKSSTLEHDPEKWEPVFGNRSCSKKKLERDDDSKKSHHALTAAGLGALAALFITEANALDCQALTKSTRPIAMRVMGQINDQPPSQKYLRIERGERTLVTIRNVDGSVYARQNFERGVPRWTEIYPAGKPLRYEDQYVDVRGALESLEEGAAVSYQTRSVADGTTTLVVDERRTIGAHASTTLAGCAIATVAVHRELLRQGTGDRATIDQLFAPELGYWIRSATKSESASTRVARDEVLFAVGFEIGE